jgi:hypothetical protein
MKRKKPHSTRVRLLGERESSVLQVEVTERFAILAMNTSEKDREQTSLKIFALSVRT